MGYFKLPFQNKSARFQIPDRYKVVHLAAPAAPGDDEQAQMVKERVSDRPLLYLLKKKVKIVVVLPDWRSLFPFEKILKPLLKNIEDNKEYHATVTLLSTGGPGAPATREDVKERWNIDLPRSMRVQQHKQDSRHNIYLGEATDEVPIYLNQHLFFSDCIITLDGVEPDLLAGYSGGWQTIAQFCSSKLTAQPLYAQTPQEDEGRAVARTWNNPYSRAVRRAASMVNIQYALQAVLGPGGAVMKIFAGDMKQAYFGAVKRAEELYLQNMDAPADLGIVGIPQGRGESLYEACGSLCLVGLSEQRPLNPGAPILCPVYLEKGLGEGPDADLFNELLKQGPDAALKYAAENPGKQSPGLARAVAFSQLLKRHPVILVASSIGKELEEFGVQHVKTMPEAFKAAEQINDSIQSILLIEDPHHAVPLLKPELMERPRHPRGESRRESPVHVVQGRDAESKIVSSPAYDMAEDDLDEEPVLKPFAAERPTQPGPDTRAWANSIPEPSSSMNIMAELDPEDDVELIADIETEPEQESEPEPAPLPEPPAPPAPPKRTLSRGRSAIKKKVFGSPGARRRDD